MASRERATKGKRAGARRAFKYGLLRYGVMGIDIAGVVHEAWDKWSRIRGGHSLLGQERAPLLAVLKALSAQQTCTPCARQDRNSKIGPTCHLQSI